MRKGTENDAPRAAAPNVFCGSCVSPLVQATDWEQEGPSLWGVRLCCPECGFEQAAVLDRPQLIYLSRAIEEGFARMLEALEQLNAVVLTPTPFDLVERARTDRIEPTGR